VNVAMYILFKILAGWFVLSVTAAAIVSSAMQYASSEAYAKHLKSSLKKESNLLTQSAFSSTAITGCAAKDSWYSSR